MRAWLTCCALLCAGFGGCSRARPATGRIVPVLPPRRAQLQLSDPNVTADQVEAIVVRESTLIPMEYLSVFEARVMKEGLWNPSGANTDSKTRGRILASYWSAIRAMPRDSGGRKGVLEAPDYFRGDMIDIWLVFSARSRQMSREGLGVAPGPLIACATDVMKRSGVEPPGNKSAEDFCSVYRNLRKIERKSHVQAVAELLRRRQFAPVSP